MPGELVRLTLGHIVLLGNEGRPFESELGRGRPLFSKVSGAPPQFREALEKYFSAVEDPSTIAILARQAGAD